MKKIIFILLIVLMLSFFGACNNTGSTEPETAAVTPEAAEEAQTTQPTQTPQSTPEPEETQAAQTPVPTSTEIPALAQVSVTLKLVEAYPNLSFTKPLFFAHAGDGSSDCYVVQQGGKILVFEDSPEAAEAFTFLDLSEIVNTRGNEEGLLGLAFHPDFENNGYFYVNYTSQTSTVVARYMRNADNPREADSASEQIILTFEQPYANHNAGHMAFGPDGYLYIATGDGGDGGDPHGYSQNRTSLLGNILRIDVDNADGDKLYSIPEDNPYAENQDGFAPEIYAYGLRNPWRFSFDEEGQLWAADVGQNKIEEIDIIINGGNYGWNVMEGTQGYKEDSGIDVDTLIPPIYEYEHDASDCITGGYVYPGDKIADLTGRYIYGDFGSGMIWALWIDDDGQVINQELMDTEFLIASFGLDADGDIRVMDLSGGIYRFELEEFYN